MKIPYNKTLKCRDGSKVEITQNMGDKQIYYKISVWAKDKELASVHYIGKDEASALKVAYDKVTKAGGLV